MLYIYTATSNTIITCIICTPIPYISTLLQLINPFCIPQKSALTVKFMKMADSQNAPVNLETTVSIKDLSPPQAPTQDNTSKDEELLCVPCGKVFTTPGKLRRHTRTTHEREVFVFSCSLCFKTLKRKDSVNKHITNVHGPESGAMAIPHKENNPINPPVITAIAPVHKKTFESEPWTRKRTAPSPVAHSKKAKKTTSSTTVTETSNTVESSPPKPEDEPTTSKPSQSDSSHSILTLEDLLILPGMQDNPIDLIKDTTHNSIELSLYQNLHQTESNTQLIKDLTISDSEDDEPLESYHTKQPVESTTTPITTQSPPIPKILTKTPTTILQQAGTSQPERQVEKKKTLLTTPIGKLLVPGQNNSTQTPDRMMWDALYEYGPYRQALHQPRTTAVQWGPPGYYPPPPPMPPRDTPIRAYLGIRPPERTRDEPRANTAAYESQNRRRDDQQHTLAHPQDRTHQYTQRREPSRYSHHHQGYYPDRNQY